jgi:hypothetical protein
MFMLYITYLSPLAQTMYLVQHLNLSSLFLFEHVVNNSFLHLPYPFIFHQRTKKVILPTDAKITLKYICPRD